MSKNIQRRLAEGTSSWLLFEFHCNRGNLFSEKQLVTPVGQILSGWNSGTIKTEINHPVLKTDNKKGRPLQLDFVIVENDTWSNVIETKWVTNTQISIASILWDLIRLELTAMDKNCKGYFVLSGFAKRMKTTLKTTHFLKLESKSKSLITKKNKVNLSINLKELPVKVKKHLLDKLSAFNNVTLPEKLYFEFPHRYPEKSINLTFETVVWKVNHIKTHQRYTPNQLLS